MTVPLTGVERRADRIADAALLAATAAGALCSILWVAVKGDPPLFGLYYPTVQMLWTLYPALLVLGAYLLAARFEGRAGIRRQRGALAALVGFSVICAFFTYALPFSSGYGLALLALAVRTRGTLAAATGVLAVAVALGPTMARADFADWQLKVSYVLVAVAGSIAAVRSRREAAAVPAARG